MQQVQYFITGKTIEELAQNQIKLNNALNRTFKYDNFIKDGKRWVSWFSCSQTELPKIIAIINGLK